MHNNRIFISSNETNFTGPMFYGWNDLINVGNASSFLKINLFGEVCSSVHGYEIPMYMFKVLAGKVEEVKFTGLLFDNIVSSTRVRLREIIVSLLKEIRDRFRRYSLLEAMAIVNPTFWNPVQNEKYMQEDYFKRLNTLIQHFCKPVDINGMNIPGILRKDNLISQSHEFSTTMCSN